MEYLLHSITLHVKLGKMAEAIGRQDKQDKTKAQS